MKARDFRGLGRPAQEALRRRALFLIEREGMTQAEAARAVGVHRQTVNIWHKRYRERGEGGLLDGRRVSPRRGKGLLTAEGAGQVRAWVAEGTPDRLKLPWALWTSRGARAGRATFRQAARPVDRAGYHSYQRPELLTRLRARSLEAPDAVDRRCSRSAEGP